MANTVALIVIYSWGSIAQYEYQRAFKGQDFGVKANLDFVKDALQGLNLVDKRMKKQLDSIKEETSRHCTDYSIEQLMAFNPIGGELTMTRNWCRALSFSLRGPLTLDHDNNNNNNHMMDNYSQFSFRKVCHLEFAALENAENKGLPIFCDEALSDVLITAPKIVFQTLIFSLVFLYFKRDSDSIFLFSCKNNGNDDWKLQLQVVCKSKKKSKMNTSQDSSEERSTRGVHQFVARAVDDILPLDLNERPFTKQDYIERIIERITMEYLHTSFTTVDEFRDDFKFSTVEFPLSQDVCSVVQQKPQTDSNNNNAAAATAASSSAIQSRSGIWLFIAQRTAELVTRTEIREKLHHVLVPTKAVAISNLDSCGHHPVALVSEQLLSKLFRENRDKDKEIPNFRAFADYLIVVCDFDSTPDDIKQLYGVDAAKCLNSKIGLKDLFHFVMEVTELFKPREIFIDGAELLGPQRLRNDIPSRDKDERWIGWLKNLCALMVRFSPEDATAIRDVLETRMSQIQVKEWKHDDAVANSTSVYKFKGLDIVNDLDSPFKRKAASVIEFFLPKLHNIREKLKKNEWSAMLEILAAMNSM